MRMRNIDEHLSRSMNTFFTSSRAAAFFLAAISLVEVTGCGRKHRSIVASVPRAPAQRPMTAVPLGYTEEGIASWYGHPYHGRPAADGEIYDMEKLVAAHRLMPFNTWVRVTNLQNGKTIDVRIIDRGPFVEGRIIDLSKAAARHIDLLGPGIGRVRVQVIAAPVDVPADDVYAVQVGAFSQKANALPFALAAKWTSRRPSATFRRGRKVTGSNSCAIAANRLPASTCRLSRR